jgi:hypothetical protein
MQSLQEAVGKAGDTLKLQGVCSGIPDDSPTSDTKENGLYIDHSLTLEGDNSGAYLITQPSKDGSGKAGPSNVVAVGDDQSVDPISVAFAGNLTMNGWTKDSHIDPVAAGGVMYVSKNANVTIHDRVTLDGGYANQGGSIYNNAGTIDSWGTIKSGYAVETTPHENGQGGGIFSISKDSHHHAQVNLHGTAQITGNEARYGGGIFEDGGGYVTLNGHATITGNKASDNGGGIFEDGGGHVTLRDNSTIMRNNAAKEGGGIFSTGGGRVTINPVKDSEGPQITGNTAIKDGGGIYLDSTSDGFYLGDTQMHHQVEEVHGNSTYVAGTNNIRFPKP